MFVYITSNATVWMRIFECRAPFFPFSSSNRTTVENFLMAFLSVFKPLLSLCDIVLLSSLFSCFLGYALIAQTGCSLANLQYHFRVPCYFDNASCIHNQIRSHPIQIPTINKYCTPKLHACWLAGLVFECKLFFLLFQAHTNDIDFT